MILNIYCIASGVRTLILFLSARLFLTKPGIPLKIKTRYYLISLVVMAVIIWLYWAIHLYAIIAEYLLLMIIFVIAVPKLLHCSSNLSTLFFCLYMVITSIISTIYRITLGNLDTSGAGWNFFGFLVLISITVLGLLGCYAIWKRYPEYGQYSSHILLLPVTSLRLTMLYLLPFDSLTNESLVFWISISGITAATIFLALCIFEIHHNESVLKPGMSARLGAGQLLREYRSFSEQYAAIRKQEHDIRSKLMTLDILMENGDLEQAKTLAENLGSNLKSLCESENSGL